MCVYETELFFAKIDREKPLVHFNKWPKYGGVRRDECLHLFDKLYIYSRSDGLICDKENLKP